MTKRVYGEISLYGSVGTWCTSDSPGQAEYVRGVGDGRVHLRHDRGRAVLEEGPRVRRHAPDAAVVLDVDDIIDALADLQGCHLAIKVVMHLTRSATSVMGRCRLRWLRSLRRTRPCACAPSDMAR